MDRMERRQRKLDEQAGKGEVDFGEIVNKLNREEMLATVARFLVDDAGYEMLPPSPIGETTPDFHVRRTEEGVEYHAVGMLALTPDEVNESYDKLVKMHETWGEKAEYTLAVHQMPEYLLYDMLEADRGSVYIGMKEREFQMWICYSTEEGEGVWCFLGGSRDRLLEGFFTVNRRLTAEAIVGPRVSDMLMEDEEF